MLILLDVLPFISVPTWCLVCESCGRSLFMNCDVSFSLFLTSGFVRLIFFNLHDCSHLLLLHSITCKTICMVDNLVSNLQCIFNYGV